MKTATKKSLKAADKNLEVLAHRVAQAWAAAPNSAGWMALEAELNAAWEARWA